MASLTPANSLLDQARGIEPMAARLAAANMTEGSKLEGKRLIREGHRALRSGELRALLAAVDSNVKV